MYYHLPIQSNPQSSGGFLLIEGVKKFFDELLSAPTPTMTLHALPSSIGTRMML